MIPPHFFWLSCFGKQDMMCNCLSMQASLARTIPSISGMPRRMTAFFLTGNHRDFLNLHNLVLQVGGHHPGIFVVRRDNNPKRDLTPAGTVRAIRNFAAANVPVRDEYVILNHWR